MSDAAPTSQIGGSNGGEQAQQSASFDLPEETTQTALKKDDRTIVVDLQTGVEVPEPVARSKDSEIWFWSV